MGLFDSLTGGSGTDTDDDDEERVLEHYEICKTRPQGGGWQPIEGYEELSFPMGEEEFRYNEEPLEGGLKYKIFGVDQNGRRMKPPEDEDWMFEMPGGSSSSGSGGGSGSSDMEREITQLRNEVRQLAQSGADQGKDPGQIMDEIRANLLASAVSNEDFMARYGEKVFDWALDAQTDDSGNDGPGYEDFSESPMAAVAYDMTQTMMNEPHKMRELGENMGGGLGGLLDGMAAGADLDTTPDADDEADGDQDAGGSRLEEIDGGPTTLKELDAGDDVNESEELADELTEKMAAARETEQDATQEAPAEAEGQATIEDSAADTAPAADENDPHDMKDVTESGTRASPNTADVIAGDDDRGLDPNRCQHVKDDGEQCGNPKEQGSEYCWMEDHGPDEAAAGGTDQADAPDEPDATTDPSEPPGDGEPSEEEVADVI